MNRTPSQIAQNLKDAGCTDEVIQIFLVDLEQGKTTEGMKLLEHHRRQLLVGLHLWQKKIDCLDYLIYQMKKDRKR